MNTDETDQKKLFLFFRSVSSAFICG